MDIMDADTLYLRPDVQVEPLIDQWYAWPHLIPPATAARNMTERHAAIMDSYIAAPDAHAAAVRNKKMLGGPFIDYQGGRVGEIRALRERLRTERPHLMELSRALADLDVLLQAEAHGYSLQALYPKVPAPLRGYVELLYDLNNHPSYRLLEPLLYKSAYYDRSLQSLMLSVTTGDDRPFVLSTPRLESAAAFHWPVAYDDEAVDALFRIKTEPAPFGEVSERLGGVNGSAAVVRSFLTPQPPPRYQPYAGPAARWRYFGHACVLVETPHVSLLFDPVLSYTYDSSISRYTYQDLPDVIDYVLITHNHQDHVLLETMLQLRHRIRHVVVPRANGTLQDPSLKLLLENVGFRNVIALDEMEAIVFPDGRIIGLPFFGEHADLDIRSKTAYVVRVGGRSLLFAADSCNIEPALYAHVHREIGDVDAVFLGMECLGAPLSWLYGPLLTKRMERSRDESRRFAGSNYEQGLRLVEQFNCREVYVYAMGQEPWLNHVMSLKWSEQSKPIVESNRLLDECRRRGLAAERLFGEREMFLG